MGAVSQPISDVQAESLFDAICEALGAGSNPVAEKCDHTLRHAGVWAMANGVDFADLRSWLHDNGGFCDCEVLWNVMPDDEGDDEEGIE